MNTRWSGMFNDADDICKLVFCACLPRSNHLMVNSMQVRADRSFAENSNCLYFDT